MTQSQPHAHIAVVGGGIAGLTAAVLAAREGARVTVFERISQTGGRGRTRERDGFRFNMGAHALYQGGPAQSVLSELGVAPKGSRPPLGGALGLADGRLDVLPGGPLSLMTTALFTAREKAAFGAALARLPRIDPAPWQRRTLREFVDETFRTPRLRATFEALVRLSSYAHAPEQMSAGTAISQLQLGSADGVLYLDGGWQRMIGDIETVAREASVEIRCGARVRAVERLEGERVRHRVVCRDAEPVAADAVILAMGPSEASALVDGGSDPFLAEQAARALPVRAACLDVGLDRLPDAKRTFALGIDVPTYLSLHSAAARELAPSGGALFHAARYLAPDEKPDRGEIEALLESQLDLLQPGWRDHVVEKTLLLDVPAAHVLPTAEMGGLPGRPRVDALAARRPGLMLCGDWIGPEGWLADASFASGRDAGRAAAAFARSVAHG